MGVQHWRHHGGSLCGGGIFLAPWLHLTRWNRARQIAATTSLFIFINSLAGLAGQLAKAGPERFGQAIFGALPLMVAVLIGGQIGSLLALRRFAAHLIRWLTAALTIWAGANLIFPGLMARVFKAVALTFG